MELSALSENMTALKPAKISLSFLLHLGWHLCVYGKLSYHSVRKKYLRLQVGGVVHVPFSKQILRRGPSSMYPL